MYSCQDICWQQMERDNVGEILGQERHSGKTANTIFDNCSLTGAKGGEAYEKAMDSKKGDDAAWERSN